MTSNSMHAEKPASRILSLEAGILSEDFCYERRRIFVTDGLEARILNEDFCYERLRSRDPKGGFLLRTACHTLELACMCA